MKKNIIVEIGIFADDIKDIHKCFMKKNNIIKNVWIY